MLSGDLFGTRRESGPAGSLVYPRRSLDYGPPPRTPAPSRPALDHGPPQYGTDLDGPPIPAARPTDPHGRGPTWTDPPYPRPDPRSYGSPSQPAPVGPDPDPYSRRPAL